MHRPLSRLPCAVGVVALAGSCSTLGCASMNETLQREFTPGQLQDGAHPLAWQAAAFAHGFSEAAARSWRERLAGVEVSGRRGSPEDSKYHPTRWSPLMKSLLSSTLALTFASKSAPRAVLPALVAAVLVAACGLPVMADSEAGRCGQGIDLFENGRCGKVAPLGKGYPTVEAEYQGLKSHCPDPASQARIARLASCIDGYKTAAKGDGDKRDEIRRKYADQVVALQADPAYKTTLEQWLDARDEAVIAEQEWTRAGKPLGEAYWRRHSAKGLVLDTVTERLRALISKHGIDPKHSQVLGIW